MPLPGTVIANAAIEKTGLRRRVWRLFTEKRANDRSHKIWGDFTQSEAEALVATLKELGGLNPRMVMRGWASTGSKYCSGVRFEVA